MDCGEGLEFMSRDKKKDASGIHEQIYREALVKIIL